MLAGRRVVLAVTGGVAAYKSAYLARLLVEAGVDLRVILTESAQEFVGAQTFAAITGSQPYTQLFGQAVVSPHTELGRWAELIVVAPATAASMAKVAQGLALDLASATLLASTSPVLLAPAMHTEMWEHPATRRNVELLESFGYRLVGPAIGPLAGGDEGIGRMAEPEEIHQAIEAMLAPSGQGRRVLVTAGGTREPIDPVRFLGNRSSGKMGHAIADAAAARGARVTLITTSDLPVLPSVKVVRVETAEEMLEAVSGEDTDIAVMAAAVADFAPVQRSDAKLARKDGAPVLELTTTPDILASVVNRPSRPYIVGFAAETAGLERAVAKTKEKGVDLLVHNDVTEPGAGFGTDTNRVVIIDPEGDTESWPMLSKAEVASRLVERVFSEVATRG